MTLNNSDIVKTQIHSGGIFRIILNNPKKHNVLSEDMMLNIQAALNSTINNNKIRVIIISAEGKTFSAGHDLKELKEGRKNPDKGKNIFKKL